MRSRQLLAVIFLCPALCFPDTFSVVDIFGPSVTSTIASNAGFTLEGTDTTLVYDSSGHRYPYSGAVIGQPDFWSLNTGPLLKVHQDSWVYAGGGSINGGEGNLFAPIPPGYPSCEAAGLVTVNPSEPNEECAIADPLGKRTVGSFTGAVTFAFSNVIEGGEDGLVSALFDLNGPVIFNISTELAFLLGISSGPYIGTIDASGFYVGTEAAFDQFQNTNSFDSISELDVGQMQLNGTSVPEPSALLLLATALAAVVLQNERISCIRR